MLENLPTKINPSSYEVSIYNEWVERNYFKVNEASHKTPYSIVIPPPNVTGSLHMGHALNITLQDILIRYHRLKGYEVLWIPGTDHAGIATQNVVEKKLAEKGLTRHDLGREKFIEEVWLWRTESGGTILNQLKRLGASLDWSKERFTMDDGLSEAVKKVFVSLYKKNLIYRANYMVNWCPRCLTALSDLEVEHSEIDGHLYYIKYPIEGSVEFITIATTRPETMLGDTGIAINDKDERYKRFVGCYAILPIVQRKIPIIEDSFVDITFGTGALKLTPSHDPIDFEIGKKYNLEEVDIFDDRAFINENGGKFKGLDRFKARQAIVEELKSIGLLVKVEPYKHNVGHCYRCKNQIEPKVSMQWFVKIKSLSEKAVNIVEDGKIRIIPDTWTKTYYEWMNNIKDWCISRQIWWGHRIPAWHCKKCGQITVEVVEPERCVNCGSSQLTQESDVLDTWFSSALWPFSTMGWPEDTALFKKFYPTNCLVTGFDILFFWVARMIMMGIEFTGLEPFKDVYIHALVRDIEGKKMSKSKGNIIDPLTLIEKYSADALRFTLSAMAAQGRDIKLSEERVEGYRNFMNKIWNATRFILSNTDELNIKFDIDFIEIEDKWILDRLSKAIFDSERFITNYEFDRAANTLYNFFWHEFCDWYIEFIKMRIYKNNKKIEALGVALYVLEKSLILMHPFMPFITEYIYKLITGRESVLLETFPSINYTFKEASELTEVLIEFISMVRNIRGEYDINPSKVIDIFVKTESKEIKALLEQKKELIGSIAKIGTVIYTDKLIEKAAISVSTNFQIFIPLKGIIDINAQLQRLKDEKENLIKDYNLLNGKLNNPAFLEKAPKNIIEKDTLHLKEVSERLSSIDEMLQKLKKLI